MKKFTFYFLFSSAVFSQSDLSKTYSSEITSKELKNINTINKKEESSKTRSNTN